MNKSYQNINRQQGVTLLVALVMLLIMSMIAVTSLTTSTLEEKMAINTQNQISTFQAAESGIDRAINDFNVLRSLSASNTIQNVSVGFSSHASTQATVAVEFVRTSKNVDDSGRTVAADKIGTSWAEDNMDIKAMTTYFQAEGTAELKSNANVNTSVMQGFTFGTSIQ